MPDTAEKLQLASCSMWMPGWAVWIVLSKSCYADLQVMIFADLLAALGQHHLKNQGMVFKVCLKYKLAPWMAHVAADDMRISKEKHSTLCACRSECDRLASIVVMSMTKCCTFWQSKPVKSLCRSDQGPSGATAYLQTECHMQQVEKLTH